jgi:hypothetical protein
MALVVVIDDGMAQERHSAPGSCSAVRREQSQSATEGSCSSSGGLAPSAQCCQGLARCSLGLRSSEASKGVHAMVGGAGYLS